MDQKLVKEMAEEGKGRCEVLSQDDLDNMEATMSGLMQWYKEREEERGEDRKGEERRGEGRGGERRGEVPKVESDQVDAVCKESLKGVKSSSESVR